MPVGELSSGSSQFGVLFEIQFADGVRVERDISGPADLHLDERGVDGHGLFDLVPQISSEQFRPVPIESRQWDHQRIGLVNERDLERVGSHGPMLVHGHLTAASRDPCASPCRRSSTG